MRERIYLAAMLLLTLTACSKMQYLANINIDLPYTKHINAPKIDTSIALPEGGMPFSVPVQPVVTKSQEVLSTYNTKPENILHVKLKNFSQQLDKGTGNFDFIDTMRVYASAAGEPEILVAYVEKVPKGLDSLSFTCTDHNLKQYFLKDTVYIRMQGHFNKVPEATNFKLNFSFNMLANPISQTE